VFVLDPDGVVEYAEIVSDQANEPDYDRALEALDQLVAAAT
jgi:sensor domain CHASE-containing protein